MSHHFRTASRLSTVKPSITLAITAKAKSMKAAGKDIISFGAGEPDFDTPDHIKDAAKRALDEGVAKYTNVMGIEPLRNAVTAELKKVHGVDIPIDQVLVSCGAKHSLFNIFMAMTDPGDEIIIPAPYWVSYPAQVNLAGGTPVIVDTTAEDGFCLDPDKLKAAITDHTRALVLNTPCNPTGALYNRERLAAIADIVLEHDLFVISDDIYRSLVYGDAEYCSIASLSPEIAARAILVDGVSKTYAMTGWRIGFCAGPRELIKAMAKIQGQSTSNASHIAQVAATAALTGPQECVAEMRKAFDARRIEIVERLRAIPDVKCREPQGAFYAFPDISAYVGATTTDGRTLEDDVAVCDYLIDAAGVAIVPGAGFGAPGFARMSYACSMDDIVQGTQRMGKALVELKR